jgi:hypothetical protein
MTDREHLPELHAPREGVTITRNEILDVLADEGYSAGQRKNWLKGVLTRLTADESTAPNSDRQHLIDEIKTILHQQIPGHPDADDTL